MGEDVQTHVDVEAARIPDRDRLLRELQEAGLDARPVGELSIEVLVDMGQGDAARDRIYQRAEELIQKVGEPFIPIKHEGIIYIRPPVG